MMCAYRDLLDPGDRPVGVERRMLKAKQVADNEPILLGNEQAGVRVGEQGRKALPERGGLDDERCRKVARELGFSRWRSGELGERIANRCFEVLLDRADRPWRSGWIRIV
jgi:hypothetical protein